MSIYTGKATCNRDSMSQPVSGNAMNALRGRYCSMSDVMNLINQLFVGNKRKLKEFIDNVATAFELVNPNENAKICQNKITGETRSKYLV